MAKKSPALKPEITLTLPTHILDLHCHGRDLQQRHKTTVFQVLKEAALAGISTTAFMPNTLPAITNLAQAETYLEIISRAQRDLGNHRKQYLYFGALDSNHLHCERAMKLDQIIGVKIYPAKDGIPVTTGSNIGVSWLKNIIQHMEIAARHQKVVAVHCDDPDIIARDGNTKEAETEYVIKMLGLASFVPDIRLVFCHVSCRESAELILAAQSRGLDVGIELAPHYLWFDSEGTNWRKDLPAEYYKCLNNLRTAADRQFLTDLAWSRNNRIFIHSDSACHSYEDKEKGAAGLPSNQHLIKVVVTKGVQDGISEKRLQELLCFNAAAFYRLKIPNTVAPRSFKLEKDNCVYNSGQVKNPWKRSLLYSPTQKEMR